MATSISIDYAVMERSKKNKSGVVSIWMVWFRIFESVYDYLISIGHPVDENGNMVIGTTITLLLLVKDTILYIPIPLI
jgi:mannose-1-phosphate guanylyltransferase